MTRNEIYDKWLQYQNYIIIAIISTVALFFLPMLGSSVGLAFVLPTTVAGWVVYVTSKLLVAALNVIIFHCFILQGKVNAKENPNYIAATEILRTITAEKELAPRSPKQYFAGVYGKKGVTIFVTTIIAAVGLTQAVLTFDWISMLTYLFTILMGIIFGILQMNQVELYWEEEYYKYALEVQRQHEEEQQLAASSVPPIYEEVVEGDSMAVVTCEYLQSFNDSARAIGGSDVLVSLDSDGNSSDSD